MEYSATLQTPADCATDEALERHWLARLLGVLYVSESGAFVASRRRLLLRAIKRLEGGEMCSSTLRHVMAKCHGLAAGAYSYGCFDPVRFPPETDIGRYVSVGPEVSVYRRNHPLDRLSLHPYFYRSDLSGVAAADVATPPLTIGDDAWIGARALILPGCRRIGRGAAIAAGAVVTRDVPDYALVAGNPARQIRQRFNESAQQAAEGTGWWRLSPAQVNARYRVGDKWFSDPGETLR